MGFFRGVGRTVKPLVNVPKWMNSEQIGKDSSYIGDLAKSVFVPRKAAQKENFSEAVERLDLTESVIKQRYQEFKRLFIIFFIIFLLIVSYSMYLFATNAFRAGLLSLVLSGIALALTFRYNLWMYQIKKAKLGVSMYEWFTKGVLGKK